MERPKLIIATDGTHTAAMLDGVVIGQGVQKLEFSTEDSNGNRCSTLHVLDLDVNIAKFSTDTSRFMKWVNGGDAENAPAYGPHDNEVHLSAKIDTSALDAVTREVERLNDLLKEASSLVDELASKEINLSVEIEDK